MKNHVVFKFLAVLLSAFVLMTAVGSGAGIVMLSHYDLYNRTVEQGYEEVLSEIRQDFASELVFRYASMELGHCSTALVDDYSGDGALYHSFRWGRYSYSVRDQQGNEVVSVDRELPGAAHYEIPVENGRFLCLLSEHPLEEPSAGLMSAPVPTEETAATAGAEESLPAETEAIAAETLSQDGEEIIPAETIQAAEETEAASGEEETQEGEAPAEEEASEEEPEAEEASADEEEAVSEEAAEEEASSEEEVPAEEQESQEEASSEEESSEEEAPAEGENSESEEAPKDAENSEDPTAATETVPEEKTAEPTEVPEEPSAPTEPETTLPEGAVLEDGVFTYAPVLRSNGKPYYTKDQYESSFTYEYYNYRAGTAMEAMVCFANTSDYVVDLYLAHDAIHDYQIWDFLGLIGPYRGDLVLILGGSLLLFACLMAYLFCAAGKKPDSKEVQAGGVNRLPLDLYGGLAAAGMLGSAWILSIGYELFENTMMLQAAAAGFGCFLACLMLVLFLFACAAQIKTPKGFWWRNSLVFRILQLIWLCLIKVWEGLCSQGRKMKPGLIRLGKEMRRGISLMPVTWQWVLATAGVMLVLCLTIGSRKILLVILGVIVAVLATLYGGYCFGLLLDGVRRMRGGDLKAKVDQQYLLGSFGDFAEELNGLADVANTAAEKHIKSERMKTELITNVSHDIKTPLTSIINYVDLMEKPHTDEEQEVYLEVLDRQSQRLKKLIDDLMEMSKASTGNIQTDITRVDAVEAVTQALGEFADKLARAQLEPVFHPGSQEITMMADGRLVWRVLSNLLGNAVKYALPGTRVYLDLFELQDDVVISVKNVSRDELNISSEELMERFVRGDVSRNTEGSGLGLNIAKSLMELQHGQLELLVDGDLFKVTLIFPKN